MYLWHIKKYCLLLSLILHVPLAYSEILLITIINTSCTFDNTAYYYHTSCTFNMSVLITNIYSIINHTAYHNHPSSDGSRWPWIYPSTQHVWALLLLQCVSDSLVAHWTNRSWKATSAQMPRACTSTASHAAGLVCPRYTLPFGSSSMAGRNTLCLRCITGLT